MLKPSHREKSFTARRVFTDREYARAVFGAACDRTETRELYQVLMWYGVGGQGKSALLREFARMLASRNEAAATAHLERRLALAKVDLDDERLKRIDSALYSLRLQLAQSCGFAFHTFDAAFVSYYRKTRPGIDVAAEFPELFMGEKEGLADLLDVLDDHLSLVTDLAAVALPGANLIYKWGMRLTGRLKSWWSTRGNKVLAGIEQLTPEEILQKLPSYLGVDLCDGIAAKPSVRPVIFLDTYEALWRERGQKDALTDRRTDAWVRLLVQDAPGTLVVIAGRDKLRWSEIDPAWGEVIDAHLLGGLSAEDADRFLRAVPIVEDDIRAKIVGSSEGLPFYLDLQVSQYEAIRERGEAPVVAQFGGTPSDILSRFLEHLNDTDQSVLRLASYFNTITRPAMTHLADAFPQRAANFSFDRMVARSAFTPVADDAYTIHALMQEELQRREKDENEELFRKIHRHLFEYYRERAQEDDTRNLENVFQSIELALKHAGQLGAKEYAAYLIEVRSHLDFHRDDEFLKRAHAEAMSLLTSDPRSDDEQIICISNNQAVQELPDGNLAAAKETLKQLSELVTLGVTEDQLASFIVHHNYALSLGIGGFIDDSLRAMEAVYAALPGRLRTESAFIPEMLLDEAALSYTKSEPHSIENVLLRALGEFENREPLRPFSPAIALSLLSSNLSRQGRHREAVAKLFAAEHALLTALTPKGGSEGLISTTERAPSETLQSLNLGPTPVQIDRPFSRVVLDYSTLMFNSDVRASLVDYNWRRNLAETGAAGGLHEILSGLSTKVDEHPDAAEVVATITEDLRSLDCRSLIRKVHDFPAETRVRTVVFQSDKFSCQYDFRSRVFYVMCPPLSQYTKAFGALYFCETHWAAARMTGFAPPQNSPRLKQLAASVHGLNLDVLTELAEGTKGSATDWRQDFLPLLSEEGRSFIELQWAGASREELYQQYSVMWDSIRNPEAKY